MLRFSSSRWRNKAIKCFRWLGSTDVRLGSSCDFTSTLFFIRTSKFRKRLGAVYEFQHSRIFTPMSSPFIRIPYTQCFHRFWKYFSLNIKFDAFFNYIFLIKKFVRVNQIFIQIKYNHVIKLIKNYWLRVYITGWIMLLVILELFFWKIPGSMYLIFKINFRTISLQ